MSGLIGSIERLFEPASRAIRRGDAARMRGLLDELTTILNSPQHARELDSNSEDTYVARGMSSAVEGVVTHALARATGDARSDFVKTRKYALPVLHALGMRARTVVERENLPSDAWFADERCSLTMSELEKSTGARSQNLKELIDRLIEHELVTRNKRSNAQLITLTRDGLQMLDAASPGWQVTAVPVELVFDPEELAAATTNALHAYLAENHVEADAISDGLISEPTRRANTLDRRQIVRQQIVDVVVAKTAVNTGRRERADAAKKLRKALAASRHAKLATETKTFYYGLKHA